MQVNIVFGKLRGYALKLVRFILAPVSFFLLLRKIKKCQIKKLNLGAGHTPIPGWINVDIIVDAMLRDQIFFMNAIKKYPFKSGSVEYIFSEHMFEHLVYEDGMKMLAECYRVLVPGGKIRIATPDLKFLIDLYAVEKSALQKDYINYCIEKYGMTPPIRMDTVVINQFLRKWGHQIVYDYKLLKKMLEDSGFIDIKKCLIAQSEDENLRGLERHGGVIGDDFNALETLVVEASKSDK